MRKTTVVWDHVTSCAQAMLERKGLVPENAQRLMIVTCTAVMYGKNFCPKIFRRFSIMRRSAYNLCKTKTISTIRATQSGTAPATSVSSSSSTLGPAMVPEIQSIARYIPTDKTAFLVEDHRLMGSEKMAQTVSSIAPWVLFLTLLTTPFIAMKYNLDRLGIVSERLESSTTPIKKQRPQFSQIHYRDMPEVLERRSPTLVGVYSGNYHSSILLVVLRELDSLFEKLGIDIGVVVFDGSVDTPASFTEKYSPMLSPWFQLVLPGGPSLVDYTGPMTLESLVDFITSTCQVPQHLKESLIENARRVDSEHLPEFQKCVFRKKFVEKKKWLVDDTLSSSSLGDALERCSKL